LIHDILALLPVAPILLNPALPQPFSDIVMRLLEKEPDRRYQSAQGVAHDLARLAGALQAGAAGAFPLGERDFALRLSPPPAWWGATPRQQP
jgi:serine/threonine protein kinase